jgi:hypothetical protein
MIERVIVPDVVIAFDPVSIAVDSQLRPTVDYWKIPSRRLPLIKSALLSGGAAGSPLIENFETAPFDRSGTSPRATRDGKDRPIGVPPNGAGFLTT